VNLCLHRLERERLRRAHPLDAHETLADPAPDESRRRTEAREHLEHLLARLTPEHRAILVLRELEQLSYRDIAAVLHVPEGTVMSRLARARAELVRLAAKGQVTSRTAPSPLLEAP
jgi:RNA polymerase sigma-70 factor (ECF subfamily)